MICVEDRGWKREKDCDAGIIVGGEGSGGQRSRLRPDFDLDYCTLWAKTCRVQVMKSIHMPHNKYLSTFPFANLFRMMDHQTVEAINMAMDQLLPNLSPSFLKYFHLLE